MSKLHVFQVALDLVHLFYELCKPFILLYQEKNPTLLSVLCFICMFSHQSSAVSFVINTLVRCECNSNTVCKLFECAKLEEDFFFFMYIM